MAPRATLVVFAGGFGTTPAERLVDEARLRSAFDAIDMFSGEAILITDGAALTEPHPELVEDPPAAADPPTEPAAPVWAEVPSGVTIDFDPGDFHFGRRLAGVIRRHNLTTIVYMGAGSIPLFGADDFAGFAATAAAGIAVTNNLYSSDIVAFPVRDNVLEVIEALDRDNALARVLHERTHVRVEEPPRTLANQFDIDTPTDVATLALTGLGGPRLREYLATLDLPLDRYRTILPYFLDTTKQLLVAGRVGTHAWQYLERETACRVRLFAEERGMEADGRAESGAARSLLGLYLDEVGPERFFQALPQLCDAALIDTRVLLAHQRIAATRSDRFLSDLGQWPDVADPFLGDFTRAAAEAPIPVLLGGHSLMSGDLMALNEYVWSLRDAGQL